MSNIKIFENEEFGKIRSVMKNGQIWFVSKDICDALGYSAGRNAISAHVAEDDKLTHRISASGQMREVTIINESGLYALIFGSKLDKAIKFKHWVTSEVLPSIRKTGSYSVKPKRMTKAQRQRLDNATKAERRLTAELWLKFGDMTSNQIHKEICTYYGTTELAGKEVLALPEAKEKTYSATEIGELLGVSANKIGRLARQNAMKTEKYGRWFYDKSAYSDKTVESFRYYEKAIDVFRKLVEAA